jgi:hypothetical protein
VGGHADPGPLQGGEHHHLDLGQPLADAGRRLHPVKPWHAPVHQHHIRPQCRRLLDPLGAVGGFPDDLDAGVLQQRAQDPTHGRRVIDQQHPRHPRGLPAGLRLAGRGPALVGIGVVELHQPNPAELSTWSSSGSGHRSLRAGPGRSLAETPRQCLVLLVRRPSRVQIGIPAGPLDRYPGRRATPLPSGREEPRHLDMRADRPGGRR